MPQPPLRCHLWCCCCPTLPAQGCPHLSMLFEGILRAATPALMPVSTCESSAPSSLHRAACTLACLGRACQWNELTLWCCCLLWWCHSSPLDATCESSAPSCLHRAARTLVVYLQETNLNVCQWLMAFMRENPITLTGSWEVRAVHGLGVQARVQHAGRILGLSM